MALAFWSDFEVVCLLTPVFYLFLSGLRPDLRIVQEEVVVEEAGPQIQKAGGPITSCPLPLWPRMAA